MESSAFISCVTWGQTLNFCMLQFCHLESGDNTLSGRLCGLGERRPLRLESGARHAVKAR